MSLPYAGEFAALATAFFFSIGPMFFTLAGRRVGSPAVNRLRLLIAAVLLMVLHGVLHGRPLPPLHDSEAWLWLALSGIVGLAFGDACLFQAFVLIGARLTMLIWSLSPILAALSAWIWLGESLGPLQILGVIVTLAGVTWVVADRPDGEESRRNPRYLRGLLLAFGGAAGQALGMVIAKKGLGDTLPALSGHVIRLGAATIVLWSLAVLQGRVGSTLAAFRGDRPALAYTSYGAALGPVFGVWCSLIAIRLAPVGVATTLMALPPVFLLPIGRFVFKERFGWRAVLGTLVAVGGVILLFLA